MPSEDARWPMPSEDARKISGSIRTPLKGALKIHPADTHSLSVNFVPACVDDCFCRSLSCVWREISVESRIHSAAPL